MYNKLFTKIVDSSIWLEPTPTRIVWVTFLAIMDEDGFVGLTAVGNVASRARISLEDARTAIECLEGPDSESADQEHEGRRIERVPGGWMVLNARKYRDLVTRAITQDRTRERVRKHREKKRLSNAQVTPSESDTESDPRNVPADLFERFWKAYPKKKAKDAAKRAFAKRQANEALLSLMIGALERQAASVDWRKDGGQFIPHPATWLNGARWLDQDKPDAATTEDRYGHVPPCRTMQECTRRALEEAREP